MWEYLVEHWEEEGMEGCEVNRIGRGIFKYRIIVRSL